MDQARFWKIIETSRRKAKGDQDEHLEALRAELEKLSAQEVAEFDHVFDELWANAYRWDLWGAAYVIGGGCSDDGFMDFRSWLISRGQEVYEAALKDPDSLAEVVPDEDDESECEFFEEFRYVPGQVWAEKTGKDGAEFPPSNVSFPKEPVGEPWAEEGDDLKRWFPRLCKKFDWD